MAKGSGFKMTKVEKSWVKYDVGNSAMFMLATALIPIYFNGLVADAGMGENSTALVIWSYATSISTFIVALLMPILGSTRSQPGKPH